MFKLNNKDTPGIVLVSLLLTCFAPCSSVSIVNFEPVKCRLGKGLPEKKI